MIIGVTGYGYTGSGAVIDYLKGYNQVEAKDNVEFQLLQAADGVLDLKYHLTKSRQRINCNCAIKRFITLQSTGTLGRVLNYETRNRFLDITMNYVNNLVMCEWQGESAFDPCDVDIFSYNKKVRCLQEYIKKILYKVHVDYPSQKIRYYSAMSEQEFDDITSKYIMDVFQELNIPYKEKHCVLDMLFSATNPQEGMEFFESPKCIVVDRNPIDIWIVSKRTDDNYSFMPNDKVEKFVNYYRLMRENQKKCSNALYIQYEDLIYKYDDTKEKINNYLGFANNPEREFMYFDPNKSVVYTNLEKKETINVSEINYIKENLKEYLYRFPS